MDPIGILGTAVGLASLTIQVTSILHEYINGVKNHRDNALDLLNVVSQLSEALGQLEDFLRAHETSFSRTSTLYSASTQCEQKLIYLKNKIKAQIEGGKKKQALHAMLWPFKKEEHERIVVDLQGYQQIFQFALSIEGCEILMKTSQEVSEVLRRQISLNVAAQQSADKIMAISETVSELPHLSARVDNISRGIENLNLQTEKLREANQVTLDKEEQEALDWVFALGVDMISKHQAVLKNLATNTGTWFFKEANFHAWQEQEKPILWCSGKPGSGKSTLLSKAIHDQSKRDSTKAAFFYFENSQLPEIQTPETIIACFIWQICANLPHIPGSVMKLYHSHLRKRTRPNLEDLMHVWTSIVENHDRLWLFLDAMDECTNGSPLNVLELLQSLATSAVSIMVTSRLPPTDPSISGMLLLSTIFAQAEDLEILIRSRFHREAKRLHYQPSWPKFVDEVCRKLVGGADGMFILVKFQVDLILRNRTIDAMRKALQTLPGEIKGVYEATFARMDDDQRDIASQVIGWILSARRLLTFDELQQALAIRQSGSRLNEEAMICAEDILESCFGLVQIDMVVGDVLADNHSWIPFPQSIKTSSQEIVSLVHATVGEYVQEYTSITTGFQAVVVETCLKCCIYTQHAAYERASLQNPFYLYAYKAWPIHFQLAQEQADVIVLATQQIILESSMWLRIYYSTPIAVEGEIRKIREEFDRCPITLTKSNQLICDALLSMMTQAYNKDAVRSGPIRPPREYLSDLIANAERCKQRSLVQTASLFVSMKFTVKADCNLCGTSDISHGYRCLRCNAGNFDVCDTCFDNGLRCAGSSESHKPIRCLYRSFVWLSLWKSEPPTIENLIARLRQLADCEEFKEVRNLKS